MISNDSTSYAPPNSGTYDYDTWVPGAGGFPAVGETYTDPIFGGSNTEGSIVRRMTNIGANANGSEIYAHHWGNADGTYCFDDSRMGANGLQILDTSDGTVLWTAQPTGTTNRRIQWHPTNPDKYLYLSGNTIIERTLSTQSSSTIKNFGATLGELGSSHPWVDSTGRYYVVIYSTTVKVWDRTDDVIYTTGAFAPAGGGGYTTISPDGAYLIDVGGSTSNAYPLDHGANSIGSANDYTSGTWEDHGAFISASDGKNYAVHRDGNGNIRRYDISLTTQAGTVVATYNAANENGHMSAVHTGSFVNWVFYTSYQADNPIHTPPTDVSSWRAYKDELRAFNVVTLEERRFCHLRWRYPGEWTCTPRGSCSWDGSFIMWISNFNDDAPTNFGDFYGINNPLGEGGAGGGFKAAKGSMLGGLG